LPPGRPATRRRLTYSSNGLADKLKLPVAVFFFPELPSLPPIRESFRILPDAEFDMIPRQVGFLLRKGKALQLNLAELSQDRKPAPRLITRDGIVTLNSGP
jgi:hypothetical protein